MDVILVQPESQRRSMEAVILPTLHLDLGYLGAVLLKGDPEAGTPLFLNLEKD